MALSLSLQRDPRRAAILFVAVLCAAALLLLGARALFAQIGGDRGIAPVAASGWGETAGGVWV